MKRSKTSPPTDWFAGLSEAEIEAAKAWAAEHYPHVQSLAQSADHAYAPTLPEDRRNPALWKAAHWRWFLTR